MSSKKETQQQPGGDATVRRNASLLTSQLKSGDVVLMDRKCWSMKDPLSIGLCLCAKTVSRFDHVGVVYRAPLADLQSCPATCHAVQKAGGPSPTDTYIVEANVGGVTLRSMEARLLRTNSNEIAVRPLEIPDRDRSAIEAKLRQNVEASLGFDYKSNLMDFVAMSLKPPDKVDRMMAAKKMRLLYNEIMLIHDRLLVMDAERLAMDGETAAAPSSRNKTLEERQCAVQKRNALEQQRRFLTKLRSDFLAARLWLARTYFAHLPSKFVSLSSAPTNSIHDAKSSTTTLSQSQPDTDMVLVDFDSEHLLFVDGENCGGPTKGVFCSELVVHLWQRSDIVKRFPPATSFSPSDFDHWDDEFNFFDEAYGMGTHQTIFPIPNATSSADPSLILQRSSPSPAAPATLSHEAFVAQRLHVLQQLYRSVDTAFPFPFVPSSNSDTARGADAVAAIMDSANVLPTRWMLQTTTHYQLRRDMPERVMVVGCLFTAVGVLFGKMQLRNMELQLGLLTTRGTGWSLSLMLAARSVLAAAIQSWLTYAALHQRVDSSDSSSSHTHTQVMRREGAPTILAGIADDRHPFYTCSGLLIGCGSVACVATHVLERAALSWHFGPQRPAPPRLPMFLRGALTSSLYFSFSYGGGWLIWYECFGPLYFTNETSTFRLSHWISQKREDRWVVQQRDAIAAAIGVTLTVEAVLYPFQSRSRRQFMRRVYAPQPPPSRNVSVFAGLGRHLLRSAGICAVTVPAVWTWLL